MLFLPSTWVLRPLVEKTTTIGHREMFHLFSRILREEHLEKNTSQVIVDSSINNYPAVPPK